MILLRERASRASRSSRTCPPARSPRPSRTTCARPSCRVAAPAAVAVRDPALRGRRHERRPGSRSARWCRCRSAGPYELYFVFSLQRETATVDLVRRTFLLGGFVLVLLVGAVAYVVTRQVVSPVRRAVVVAERLSSGRLQERMTSKGEDDLARLGASFNAMAANLQDQIRRLEDLSRVQQRFVSDVSHELRTPMTTIRMAGEILHDARHDFTPSVARSAELLQNQLDRFESLLVGPAGDQPVRRRRGRPGPRAGRPARRRGPGGRGLPAAGRPARQPGHRRGRRPSRASRPIDPRRVERILVNLVVNAIEHGEGRPVTVRLGVLGRRGRGRRRGPRRRAARGRDRAGLQPVLAGRPGPGPDQRRHRARPGHRPRGRPAARRLAAGLGPARQGLGVPADPAPRGWAAR